MRASIFLLLLGVSAWSQEGVLRLPEDYSKKSSTELYALADSTDSAAIVEIGKRKDPGALPLLRSLDARLRASPRPARYADALGKLRLSRAVLGDPAARREFENGLRSKDVRWKKACLQALGETGDKKYVKAIAGLLDSKDAVPDDVPLSFYAAGTLAKLLPDAGMQIHKRSVWNNPVDNWKSWWAVHRREYP